MKKLFFYFLVIAGLLNSFSGIQAQELEKKGAEIDQVMNLFVKLDQFSGCVLVARDGKPFYAKAFGEADKNFQIKNNLTTKFNIGSIGKIFTATAIMQLAQHGKLQVNDPVSKYLKDFPYSEKITIHHLLTHTTDTYNYFVPSELNNQKQIIRDVPDALPLIYDQKLLQSTQGESFSSSNSSMVILGAIIEAITGQNYHDFINKNIFRPLGMYNTDFQYLEEIVENRAIGYEKSSSGRYEQSICVVPPVNTDAGIETTVEDFLRFDQALYGEKLLNAKYKKLMFTPFKENYGYCWRISEKYGQTVIGYSGGAPGMSAGFRRYIDDRYTIIVFSNYSDKALPVSKMIETIIFDGEYNVPSPTSEAYFSSLSGEMSIEELLTHFNLQDKKNGYNCRLYRILNFYGYDF